MVVAPPISNKGRWLVFFSSPSHSDRPWGLVGIGGSLRGNIRPRHEADHAPTSSAEIKNAWSYYISFSYVIKAWCLVKHRIHLHGSILA